MAAILVGKITVPTSAGTQYSSFAGFAHLAAGLACGLSSLAAGEPCVKSVLLPGITHGLCAGLAIGVVGDAGVRAVGQQSQLYVCHLRQLLTTHIG